MRICIFGAGAIGGGLAVFLARAGHEVSVVARGLHLRAIRTGGLRVRRDGRELRADVAASDDPAELGVQDTVFVTVKAHSLPGLAGAFAPLLGPDTAVVTAMNGVPYWYFHGDDGPFRGQRLTSLDPEGALWRALPPERAIGCVVYPASAVVEPGVIAMGGLNRFPLGEPDGTISDRVRGLSEVMTEAGIDAPVVPRIRDEIWSKLWGNLTMNPLSVLTLAGLGTLATSPVIRPVVHAMMEEGRAVGQALGVRFAIGIEERIGHAAALGDHKTSMLQDLEGGRPMEIDALVGVVGELGRLTGVSTPTIDTVLQLVRMRALA
ncbi:2-dehydropantoate 2-reductase [Marinivivus vitaminiproducens]|uniref:2-dehydropantoate 2-reductase n=1 Tax=Marinivivus vitaminiproducens TaxID=3035935 RepID=UPI002799922E|nr:2-dehydropantoate 2-reductase [Geminicoccaceae bacterium SCSIO 64248]